MINVKLDRFLNSQKLAASIFLITGANKTYRDYVNADEKYKNRFLMKDTYILAGAATGMFLQKKYSPSISDIKPLQNFLDSIAKKISNTKFAKKIQKPMEYSREIVTDMLKNVSMFASGIIGALAVDLILSKIKFLNPDITIEKTNETTVDAELNSVQDYMDKKLVNKVIPNSAVKNAMYERITDMPQLVILTGSLAGANAIDLAKETELKTKLQHTGNCIINNSMLPMLYLAIANVLTKNLQTKYKIPAIFGILVGGTLITSKLSDLKIKFLSQKAFKNIWQKNVAKSKNPNT